MPDPFAFLPLPLLIFVLNDLEDLVSLHAILVANPPASRVFNVHYETLACILTHHPPHLLHLVCAILSIRSRPAQIKARCSRYMQSSDAFRATTIVDNKQNISTSPLSNSSTTQTAAVSIVTIPAQLQGLMLGLS